MPNLVGIGLSQVPTNSMLGGMAYQDPEHASIKDLDLKNLSQINSEISDTAVDVFVYDTRKDSDGGAWRKRTQHTSWYNETLGTANRGTRKEFPAVAVLVLQGTVFTIYDGDDPDLPMWMVFNKASNSYFSVTTNSCVTALNGKIVSGGNASNDRLRVIDFLLDNELEYSHTSGQRTHLSPISGRNGAAGFTAYDSSLPGIIDRYVNDVAMTVLPNAPIDDTTGLPIPTIAVGTDGGPSIIKDDGTVVDLTYQESSNRIVRMIDIDSNGRIYWSTRETGSAPGVYFHEADLPAADSSAEPPVNISANQAGVSNAVKPTLIDGNLRDVVRTKDRTVISISGSDNKGHLNLYNVTGDVNSSGSVDSFEMVDISTDYNTGYIIGDIKGAFLSDTDDTNITGSNLIDNGDFGTGNFTNWTIGGDTTPTISSGGAKISTAAAIDGYVWQSTSGEATSGKWMIGWTLTANTSGFVGLVINGTQPANGNSYSSGGTLVKDGITSSGFYVREGAITSVEFRHRGGGGGHAIIDNITLVRLGDEDRSVNDNGLQVFGTITKQPVATGAELVSYSGWSSSNYLRQPYNSDLDFGTGDWSFMFWYNPNDAESGDVIFSRWSYNVDSNQGPRLSAYFNNGNLRFDTADASSGNSYQGHFGSDGTQDSNKWHCAVILRRGPNLEIWIDGKNYKDAALNSSSDGSYTDTNSILEIGHSPGNGAAEAGLELALLRVSGTAPSPEQIKKMYEDEKMLFQENAKATLYGSSDNVTAIAYDDSTNLLYAGTSSGRSEFQGLRRINNTTTAVTTAISASNGLVAEQ